VVAARYMTPEVRAKIGVEEPLDGILIGAASGEGLPSWKPSSSTLPAIW
jgi:hypothetical protein